MIATLSPAYALDWGSFWTPYSADAYNSDWPDRLSEIVKHRLGEVELNTEDDVDLYQQRLRAHERRQKREFSLYQQRLQARERPFKAPPPPRKDREVIEAALARTRPAPAPSPPPPTTVRWMPPPLRHMPWWTDRNNLTWETHIGRLGVTRPTYEALLEAGITCLWGLVGSSPQDLMDMGVTEEMISEILIVVGSPPYQVSLWGDGWYERLYRHENWQP